MGQTRSTSLPSHLLIHSQSATPRLPLGRLLLLEFFLLEVLLGFFLLKVLLVLELMLELLQLEIFFFFCVCVFLFVSVSIPVSTTSFYNKCLASTQNQCL